jgi:hypothetical protein
MTPLLSYAPVYPWGSGRATPAEDLQAAAHFLREARALSGPRARIVCWASLATLDLEPSLLDRQLPDAIRLALRGPDEPEPPFGEAWLYPGNLPDDPNARPACVLRVA